MKSQFKLIHVPYIQFKYGTLPENQASHLLINDS